MRHFIDILNEDSAPMVDHLGHTMWKNDTGQISREDGPAIITRDGDKYWYKNGKRHRIDGPAVEHTNGHKQWYFNGLIQSFDTWLVAANLVKNENKNMIMKQILEFMKNNETRVAFQTLELLRYEGIKWPELKILERYLK